MGKVIMNGKLMILLLTLVLAAVGKPLLVEGGRELKEAAGEAEVHPENFIGGMGGGFVMPGTGTGTGTGAGTGIGFGSVPGLGSSVDFCSVPGLGCVQVQPINPPALGGGTNTPLPFP